MKTKKITSIILASAMIFSLTACNNKNNTNISLSENSIESQNISNKKIAELRAKINELTEKENKVIKANEKLWDKLFNSKEKVEENTNLYNEDISFPSYLSQLIEDNKNNFTDDELIKLKDDQEKISEIETEIIRLEKELSQLEFQEKSTKEKTGSFESSENFPDFIGKDLDKNDVDSSIFKNHSVTLINFWFSECPPCVAELKDLDDLNELLKEKGGIVIGVNIDTLDGNEDGIFDAKEILDAKEIKYQNIYFDSSSDAGKIALSVAGFPTTILVNRDGEIIGEPLLGGINNKKNYNFLINQINEILEKDKNFSK